MVPPPVQARVFLAVVLSFALGGSAAAAQQLGAPRDVAWRPGDFGLPEFLTSGLRPRPATTLRLGHKPVPMLVPIRFRLPDVVTRGPVPHAADWLLGAGAVRLRRSLAISFADLARPSSPVPSLDRLARAARRALDPELADLPFATDLSGLDIEIVGRPELAGDWTRFTPCEVGLETS